MCVVAAKYFDGIGWCGVKNRDRNYHPTVQFRKFHKDDIERLVMWDSETSYSEGLNEFGVCILSASVMTKSDEKEGAKGKEKAKSSAKFYSPDGKRIRKGLYGKTALAALKILIKQEIPGNTIVFDEKECYLLEGTFMNAQREVTSEYTYKVKKIKNDEIVVRTNHGVLLPYTGYNPKGNEHEQLSRKSSDSRLKYARRFAKKAQTPDELLDNLSDIESEKDAQLNVLRVKEKRGDLYTTGQILLVAKDRTLHYRPISSEVEFDFVRLNDLVNAKTFFEIVSSRRLVSLRKRYQINEALSLLDDDVLAETV